MSIYDTHSTMAMQTRVRMTNEEPIEAVLARAKGLHDASVKGPWFADAMRLAREVERLHNIENLVREASKQRDEAREEVHRLAKEEGRLLARIQRLTRERDSAREELEQLHERFLR